MAHRPLLTVERLPLVGGVLCLDLVNTTGARDSGRPRERLVDYQALLVWCRRAGALTGAEAGRLAQRAARRPGEAARALRRVMRFREELYALFRAIAEGGQAPVPALRRLSAWWRADQQRRELQRRAGDYQLCLNVAGVALDQMLWPVVSSAVTLLTSERLRRMRRCGLCDWLFVDESRNGSRRWCKNDCGNRARVQRHYARHAAAG